MAQLSADYLLAKRLQRAANRPLNLRRALAGLSAEERRAIVNLLDRQAAIERRIAAERAAARQTARGPLRIDTQPVETGARTGRREPAAQAFVAGQARSAEPAEQAA